MRLAPLLMLALSFAAPLALADDKPAVDGTWKWSYKTKDGKDVEASVKLKAEGEKLTGAFVSREGVETPIENGTVKGDEIAFDVNRTVGDQRMLFKYSGKVAGDMITGRIVFGREKPLPHEWEAKRVKP
jgi:hypothetical protein